MPQIQTLELTDNHAKIVIEPLERGYGQTIGNALRRVLLSSIQGAAVTAIKVDKVFHEFQAIPGVKEDTTELLLNLKDLAVRLDFDEKPPEETVLTIDIKGPGTVTGADVICPEGAEVINPECYLATISDKKESLTAEIYIGWGAGYILPKGQEKYRGMIGVIPTGSQFTPVKKVSYAVEQTRVGTRTDYERLILDVWTNGSVPPNDAVTQAANILDRYFKLFFDLGNAGFEPIDEDAPVEVDESDQLPETKIEELDFSQRTFNCLRRAGILNLRQLGRATEADLNSIRGFGKKSLTEVRDKLAENGIDLKPAKGSYTIDVLEEDAGL
jgi:DNA-directed RNA polymerase subunit alpha